jgi:hypothetical protein
MIYLTHPDGSIAAAECEDSAARLEARGYVRCGYAAYRKAWRKRDGFEDSPHPACPACRERHIVVERSEGDRVWCDCGALLQLVFTSAGAPRLLCVRER